MRKSRYSDSQIMTILKLNDRLVTQCNIFEHETKGCAFDKVTIFFKDKDLFLKKQLSKLYVSTYFEVRILGASIFSLD